MKRNQIMTASMTISALLFALFGQLYFLYYEDYLRASIFFCCFLILAVGLGLWLLKPQGRGWPIGKRLAGGMDALSNWMDRQRWWALSACVLGVLLAVLSQVLLSYGHEFTLAGIGYFIAIVLFSNSILWGPRRRPLARLLTRPAWGLALLGVAVALVGAAAYLAHFRPPLLRPYKEAALLWAVGVGLGAAVLLGRRGLRGWLPRVSWREAAIVAALLAVALALRLIGLGRFPDMISGDEAAFAAEARRIMDGNLLNPFGTGWFANTTGYFYIQAAVLRLLGWNLFALRLPSAVLGALAVGAVYALARLTFGRDVALVSAAFLAGWHLPLHFSRLAFSNAADPFLGSLVFFFLQRALTRGRRADFVAAGLVLGGSLYFYVGARLLFLVVLAALFLAGANRLRRHWRGLVVLLFVVLLVAGPLLVYFVLRPQVFLERNRYVGLFPSGQLQAEQELTGEPIWLLFIEHLGPAASVFNYTHDGGYFYQPTIPILWIVSGALFVLGLVLALVRWREVRSQVLLAWVALTVVFAGWLLKLPPHYDRYLIAAPAVCMLVGLAGVTALQRVTRLLGWRPLVRRVLVVLLAVGLLVGNAVYYFGIYAPRGSFTWDRNTVIVNGAARRVAELGPNDSAYFINNPPYLWIGGSLVSFVAPDADWVDVNDVPVKDWDFVRSGRGALFVVLVERDGELARLQERFPGGTLEPVLARDGAVLFFTYWVDEAN